MQPALCLHIPRGSFHQALWPSAFAVPGLQPALCLHIALSCSGIQACRLPGFKRLKPLKTLKTLKTLQLPRGSFHQALWPSAFAVPGLQPALFLHIPRGSFHQARGRQRSSIAACPLPAHSPLLLGHSSLPFARLQTLKTLKTLQLLHCFLAAAATKPSGRQPLLFQGCSLPFACTSLAAAATKPSGRQPLLFQGCSLPFACTSLAAHQAPGRQRSSIAACPLPAHSPLLLGHSSLPFARLQTLKTLKTLKTLQLPRGSFQEALWPSAFAVPGLQPALCLHIPRGSFHQAPGRQRSSIAACPLPAHSPLLLRHSSLLFARLQTLKTLKTLKTLQLPRGSFHLQLLHCFLAAAATKPSGRQPLLFQGCSLPFACTSLAAASTKPSGRQPLLFQGCSLPFACT